MAIIIDHTFKRYAVGHTDKAGDAIRADARALKRATLQEQTRQMRFAIRGQKGYRTEWPRRRGTKTVRARRSKTGSKASITTWQLIPKLTRSTMFIGVRNKQRHGAILETRPNIRGYANIHYQAAHRTWEKQWRTMSQRAMQAAPQRVRSNSIRGAKARAARQAKAGR